MIKIIPKTILFHNFMIFYLTLLNYVKISFWQNKKISSREVIKKDFEMRIAAVFIKNHHLLGTPQFNLGGKYLYNFELIEESTNSSILISRQPNDKFIPRFYSDDDSNLSLLTAIVGGNGSGKTSLMNIMRYGLICSNSSYEDLDFILFVIENDDQVFYKIYNRNRGSILERENQGNNDFQYEVIPEFPNGEFDVQIDEFNRQIESVYYSPFFEARNFENQYSPDIDISLDSLFWSDYENNRNRDSSDPLLDFKTQNIIRQINFLRSEYSQDFLRRFNIPEFNYLKITIRKPKNNTTNPSYFPIRFRPFFNRCFDLYNEELQRIGPDPIDELGNRRSIIKSNFLIGIIETIFYSLEVRPSSMYLNTANVVSNIQDLEELDLEAAFIHFLGSLHFYLNHHSVERHYSNQSNT